LTVRSWTWWIGDGFGNWTQVGRFDEEGRFKPGSAYSFVVTVLATEGYTFQGLSTLAAFGGLSVSTIDIINRGTSATLRIGYSTGDTVAVGSLTSVDPTDDDISVSAGPVGGTVVFTPTVTLGASTGITGVSLGGISSWYEQLDDGITWVPINTTLDNKFKSNVTYSVVITVVADVGYKFGDYVAADIGTDGDFTVDSTLEGVKLVDFSALTVRKWVKLRLIFPKT